MARHRARGMLQVQSCEGVGPATVRAGEDDARRAAERTDLLAALHSAREESAARSRIMATVGHDLRQPLQAAMLVIDRVRRGADQTASARLDQALAMLIRLGGELEQLARASRFEVDQPACPKAFAVADLLAGLGPDWSEHATAWGIDLRVKPSALHVVSDPAMLSTILRNLVGNALKFTPRGGRVLVGCRRRGAALQLQVLDDGPGIAADKLTMIFEAFQRVDPADPRDGLGLGLSIVKRTAEALGHGLEVRTAPGRGSCFAVTIPLAPERHGNGDAAADAEAKGGSPAPLVEPHEASFAARLSQPPFAADASP